MKHLLVNYDSSHVRLFFRIYFFVLFVLISLIGAKLLAARTRFKLLRRRNVPVHHMSGWLTSFDSLTSAVKLRTLPAGWVGVLMILAFLLNIGSDFVSAFIQSVDVQDRCVFGTGLVVDPQRSLGLPPWNGSPYTVVSRAQAVSLSNGGLQGIYKKVNKDLNFSADHTDILGGWACTRNSQELSYPAETSAKEVVSDLVDKSLVYQTPQFISSADGPGDLINHLFVIDSSAGQDANIAFDIRASIDISAHATDDKNMQSFECKLNNSDTDLSNVLKGVDANLFLGDWKQVFQGQFYDGSKTPAVGNPAAVLERTLNSMVMVAGGANYLLDSSQADESQGCITRRTWVLMEVIALSALTAGLAVCLCLGWLVLAISNFSLKRKRARANTWTTDMTKWIDEFTPNELLDWMAQAVREANVEYASSSQKGKVVKAKDLQGWFFGWDSQRFSVLGRGDGLPVSDSEFPLVPPAQIGAARRDG